MRRKDAGWSSAPLSPSRPDTSISVTVGPGTPSAEGPLVTTAAQSFGFSTYAPLKVVEYGCYWRDNLCPPLAPFYIRFNNPLDSAGLHPGDAARHAGDPRHGRQCIWRHHQHQRRDRGQTTYTVTLSGGFKDMFGQTLGKDVDLTFKVGKAEPRLFATDQTFVTLDPAVKEPVFSVYAINYAKIDVKIYAVQPGDWEAFKNYLRDWQRTDVAVQMPGKLVFDEIMPLNLPDDTLSEVNIELAPYLKNGFGHFVVMVEPPAGMFESENDKWQRYSQTIHTWVQVTQIGAGRLHRLLRYDGLGQRPEGRHPAGRRQHPAQSRRQRGHHRCGWHGPLCHPLRSNIPDGHLGRGHRHAAAFAVYLG